MCSTQDIFIRLNVSKGTLGPPKNVHYHILPVSAWTGWETILVCLQVELSCIFKSIDFLYVEFWCLFTGYIIFKMV